MSMTVLIRREVARCLASVRSALRGVLGGVNRAAPVQLVDLEGLSGEQLKGVELFQQFGFTSAPPKGAQLIVVPLGGRTSAAVVVASEHGSYRFQVGADGEACLYNQWGDVVHMRQDRTIHLQAQAKVLIDTATLEVNASGAVNITTPQFSVSASTGVTLTTPSVAASAAITAGTNVVAAGNVADANGAKTMAAMRATFNAHTHPENNSPSNVTSATSTPM